MSFEDKVALVTGASRGIGRGIAEHLGKLGATVIGTATSQGGAEKITEYLQAAGIKGQGMMLNVCDTSMTVDCIKNIQAKHSAPTILVNNAGITRDNILLRMSDEQWQDVIDTNLSAIYTLSKLCLKPMFKARWGRIINISSVAGTMGHIGQCNYAAAKAGLIGFSKSLAQEVGSRHITVNVVSPGLIDTDMLQALPQAQIDQLLDKVPAQRLGSVDDIAHSVGFLASEQASYITGVTLHVNGGMYMT